MCTPLAFGAATTALSAASSVASYMGQNQAYKSNVLSANLGFANSENQVAQERSQIGEQDSENTLTALIDRLQAQGRVSASAADMGTSEATGANLAQGATFGVDRDLGIQQENTRNRYSQTINEQQDAILRRRSQINQVQKGSLVSLGLGFAKAGLEGGTAYSSTGGKFVGNK